MLGWKKGAKKPPEDQTPVTVNRSNNYTEQRHRPAKWAYKGEESVSRMDIREVTQILGGQVGRSEGACKSASSQVGLGCQQVAQKRHRIVQTVCQANWAQSGV